MNAAAFRRLALALPDAVEGAHHGHPDFRAHGRVIASLQPERGLGMVRVPPATQRRLVAEFVGVWVPATGAWGRAGCTMITLSLADAAIVEDALREAWQFAAANAPAPSTKRATKAKAKTRPNVKSKRSLALLFTSALLAPPAFAQEPSAFSPDGSPKPTREQIHPRTMITLGIAFGEESVETNTGAAATGVVSSSAEAQHLRLRGEHFFASDFGFYVGGFIGVADDIRDNLGAPSSSWDSLGLFAAASYRTTIDDWFRMPVRVGPYFHTTDQEDSRFVNGTVERSTFGVRLSAEPEVVVCQHESYGRIAELSLFAELACGAGPTKVEDDVDDEDAYSFTLNWELGARYRFPTGVLVGLSYVGQKFHVGSTESYANTAFFGIDGDFSAVMLTAGVRF